MNRTVYFKHSICWIMFQRALFPNKSHICNWYGTSPDMTFLERKKKLRSYKVQNHEHLIETGDIKICGTDTEQG